MMLGASRAVILRTAAAAVTYDALAASFDTPPNPSVVSYWKFENDGTDQWGTQDAVISGSPELNLDTIVELDTIAEGAPVNGKCIAWPGIAQVYAQAEHNAAHKTSQGTIVVTFQHDSLGQKSTLVAADANAAAGGLALEVQTNGSPRCFLRRQSDGAPVILVGQPGDVQLNEAYTLILKWGPAGLSMALWNAEGIFVRRTTNALTDGVTGTSPIRFGAWHTDASHHDGPYGRVIWLRRRISDTEEAILAKASTISRLITGEYVTTPEAHGWSAGNTVAQNTAAFQDTVDDASENAGSSSTGRGVVELAPSKTYEVTCTNGGANNSNGCISLNAFTSNVEIRTQGKPTGSTRAVIKFTSWAGQTGMHDRALVLFDGASNCWLTHVRLDGNKWSVGGNQSVAETKLGQIDYTSGNNGGINNIAMQGSDECRIEHVESYDALIDGMWIDIIDGTRPHPNSRRTGSLLVQDCDFHHNRRQGLSIITAGHDNETWDQVVFRRCQFRHTGEDSTGGYLLRGQKPGFGVDIEPNNTNDLLFGITFDSCDCDDNHGSTYQGTPSGAGVASISAGRGICLDMKSFTCRHFKIVGCRFRRNKDDGILIFLRDGGDVDQAEVSNNIMPTGGDANGINEIRFSQPGLLTNWLMVNNHVPLINFQTSLPDTGHSVTIWKGDFNPTVNTNGHTTIQVNSGFPP